MYCEDHIDKTFRKAFVAVMILIHFSSPIFIFTLVLDYMCLCLEYSSKSSPFKASFSKKKTKNKKQKTTILVFLKALSKYFYYKISKREKCPNCTSTQLPESTLKTMQNNFD